MDILKGGESPNGACMVNVGDLKHF